MDGFCRTDAGKVAVSLVSKYQAVRPEALDGCSKRGCTSMGSLLPVDVKVIIYEYSATYR